METSTHKITYAILKDDEFETLNCTHGVLYKFHYGKDDTFYIQIAGQLHEETSTAFNFLSVEP